MKRDKTRKAARKIALGGHSTRRGIGTNGLRLIAQGERVHTHTRHMDS